MFKVIRIEKNSEYHSLLLDFVKKCSWEDAKEHIAWMIENWVFTDWEAVFAALSDEKIVGMCSIMKTDYYPQPDIFPWISSVYVDDKYRGHRISGMLIDFANNYAVSQGFSKTYIPTEYVGLYEKYGYRYLTDITNYGGGTDRLLVKEVSCITT